MSTRLHNRRDHLQALGAAALAYSLLGTKRSLASEAGPDPVQVWLDRLYRNAGRLKLAAQSGLEWQETMDAIYADTPLEALCKHLRFDSLRQQILADIPSDRGELFHRVELRGEPNADASGREPHRALITKVAHVKKGRSIPPHGHSNMTSAFLCLSGEFAVRQYDKLEDRGEHLVVRQTVDEPVAGVGTWSSISDYRNNIHWLTAQTDDCFLFTTKLIGLEPNRVLRGRINIDVRRGESLGTNTLRAPVITSREAAERY
ncbi:cupin domain-containing protein [Roseimaritima sediminicola]|uniref:hypothetical protein n=1 Tax=Roseimaritima sediminicola TaxID=2662066 RepID=UPI0012982F35|nr:hypothetical protein [Roseimaritima sediminicola]